MTKLAADFGISDVGLAKICARHRVPTPPRGYWAKLQSGKKVKQAIFTEALDPLLNRIEIRPGLVHLPEAAREIIEKAKADRKPRSRPPTVSPAPSDIAPLQDVHPAIQLTARALRRIKPDASGSIFATGEG